MQTEALLKIIQEVLDERKGLYITTLDVRNKTTFTDYMVLVTGTSDRHLKSLCDHVAAKCTENGVNPLGIEGGLGSDWVLLDMGDIIVHAMTAQAREFYQLEKLWAVNGVAGESGQSAESGLSGEQAPSADSEAIRQKGYYIG